MLRGSASAVSTTDLASGRDSTIELSTASPSVSGKRRSNTHRSGRRDRVAAMMSDPANASATTS